MEKTEENNMANLPKTFADAVRKLVCFVRKELIVRGILFLILGLLMMFRPGETLRILTITVGIFILLDGVSMLIPACRYHGDGKIMLILNAVMLILLGLFSCTAPLMMNIIWVMMIGFWQLFSGIHCFVFWKQAGISALLSGIFSILAGLFLIFMPVLGMMTLTWVMGIISFISGISAILLGIRLKSVLG